MVTEMLQNYVFMSKTLSKTLNTIISRKKKCAKFKAKIYFCVLHKNRRERKQLFKLLFFKMNMHCGTLN